MTLHVFLVLLLLGTAASSSSAQSPAAPLQSDVGALPTALTDAQRKVLEASRLSLSAEIPAGHQLATLPCANFSPNTPSYRKCTRMRSIFRQPLQHPLTPRELAVREEVRRFGARKHQFVQCQLADGRRITGTISRVETHSLVLHRGLFGQYQTVRYSDLRTTPRPVLAVGKRVVDGLEIAGVSLGVIAVLPLVIVFIPLLAAGVISD